MGMRMELLYSVTDVTDIKCSIPNPINASTEVIYSIIEVLRLDDSFNEDQIQLFNERRNDIGAVTTPEYLFNLSDIAIDNLCIDIVTDLTILGESNLNHNIFSMYFKFIREYRIKAFYFS